MASWHYAFFFPAGEQQLSPDLGLGAASLCNLEFDNTIHEAVAIDDAGHMAGVGEEDTVCSPVLSNLESLLQEGRQFLVECRNTELFISCNFLHRVSNPHVFFGWSKRLFSDIPERNQQRYWQMFQAFAKQIHAGYVVLVDDASDNFEDRFLEVDGKRFLDTECNHQYGHGIWSVWVDQELGGECPDGVAEATAVDLGNGVTKYDVG